MKLKNDSNKLNTMNQTTKRNLGKIVTVLSLIGFTACVALADQLNQTIPFTQQTGGSGSGCPGAYKGMAKMTNAAGTYWITPPTNAVSGTFTDASGFSSPYVSVAYVQCNNFSSWCGTNSVTFPATNTAQYSFVVYVKSPLPPPTNGQPMNLQVTWQTQ